MQRKCSNCESYERQGHNYCRMCGCFFKRVNVSTGLAHPLDESAAKELLKEMYARGYSFDPAEIMSQAVSNNWSSSGAKDLANVAEKISSGKRVVIKHKNCWNPDVFDKVESNA